VKLQRSSPRASDPFGGDTKPTDSVRASSTEHIDPYIGAGNRQRGVGPSDETGRAVFCDSYPPVPTNVAVPAK
jgi:hypothetical protein